MCSPSSSLMGDQNSEFIWWVSSCSSLRDCVFRHIFRYKHHSPTLAVGNLECTLATQPKMRSLRHTDKLQWGDRLPCVSCPAMAVCTDVVRYLQGKTCDSVICFCHRLSMSTVTAHQLMEVISFPLSPCLSP